MDPDAAVEDGVYSPTLSVGILNLLALARKSSA